MQPIAFAIRSCLTALALYCLAVGGGNPSFAQAAPSPAATSVPNDYRLAPGDKIHIAVLGEDSMTGDFVISSAGNLLFPLIGNVKAEGLTVEDLQHAIATRLDDGFFKSAQVTIQTLTYLPFYVLGEVAHPGPYPVTTGMTLEQAVSTAGGYTYRANKHHARLRHLNGAAEQDIDIGKPATLVIQAGDTIRILERHF